MSHCYKQHPTLARTNNKEANQEDANSAVTLRDGLHWKLSRDREGTRLAGVRVRELLNGQGRGSVRFEREVAGLAGIRGRRRRDKIPF
jgi:hypothetical protein